MYKDARKHKDLQKNKSSYVELWLRNLPAGAGEATAVVRLWLQPALQALGREQTQSP